MGLFQGDLLRHSGPPFVLPTSHTASLSTQKQFLGGGVVKNNPNSSKLILLHHIDTNIMEFT